MHPIVGLTTPYFVNSRSLTLLLGLPFPLSYLFLIKKNQKTKFHLDREKGKILVLPALMPEHLGIKYHRLGETGAQR